MDYKAGEHVMHPKRPEWGVGRVLAIRPNGVLEVQFQNAGRRTLNMARVAFNLARVDPNTAPYAGLAADQRAAVEAVIKKREPLLLLSGAAGTGKSHVISRIKNDTTLVVAPTGLAACHVNGTTIHRAFDLPVGVIQASALQPIRPERAAVLKRIDRIVIDEVSMARADLIDALDFRLRSVRDSEAPFGGVQVVLVGDPYQLPPVANAQDRPLLQHLGYRSRFFFSSRVLKNNPVRHCQLRVQHRQKEDPGFLAILERIRDGSHTQADLARLNQRVGQTPPSAVVLSARNLDVERINKDKLAQLPGAPVVFTFTGEWPVNEKPAEETLTLGRGARVVLLRNDQQGRWVNGSQGTVLSWTSDTVEVELDEAGTVEVERSRWELKEPHIDDKTKDITYRTVGSFEQFPLRLAWALTIHRSQGMTLQNVAIDLGDGGFETGQTYVALSRVRRFEDLVLHRALKSTDIKTDSVMQQYFQWLDRRGRTVAWEDS